MPDDPVVWAPTPERAAQSNLARFMARAAECAGQPVTDYDALYRWSVDQPTAFWPLLADFTDVRFDQLGQSVLEDGDKMPGAQWFADSSLNFAGNLLKYRDERPAIIFRSETGTRIELSFADLYHEVSRVASALRAAGVDGGDRVAAFMPNHPQTVIAMLAATSIGAIWSSCSPDFGVNGVLDRFGQIAPKVLFATDGYSYAGKQIDSIAPVAQISRSLAGLEHVVVVPFLNARPDIRTVEKGSLYEDFVASTSVIDFQSLPFNHPVYVLYSSGTTGVPKCIVHGAGGTLLQHLKEHALHVDLTRDDRLFYFTTCGWMMWNWLVSGLASGATIVLYDGSPMHPDVGSLWQLAEDEEITVFGTSAKFLTAVEKAGYVPKKHKLASMRMILSTGSPLAPESYDFVYQQVKDDVQLCSISGGTDLISCFALGNPLLPVRRGELQSRGLGMAVEIYGENGEPQAVGNRGELVCTRPFPSMPVGFWDDPDGSRYRAAYFERFPGVWTHGDDAELTPAGGMIIYGRSDAILNPGGIRIGTAEIYRQVEKLDEVVESIAVGQQWEDDVRVVLFVVLRPGLELTEALEENIRDVIRTNASPRHVPAKILDVPDIPRTRSGKLVELAVRATVHGESINNTDAIANPESLEYFRNRPELSVD
jgi:acetoacetyl-CoA synthetase